MSFMRQRSLKELRKSIPENWCRLLSGGMILVACLCKLLSEMNSKPPNSSLLRETQIKTWQHCTKVLKIKSHKAWATKTNKNFSVGSTICYHMLVDTRCSWSMSAVCSSWPASDSRVFHLSRTWHQPPCRADTPAPLRVRSKPLSSSAAAVGTTQFVCNSGNIGASKIFCTGRFFLIYRKTI